MDNSAAEASGWGEGDSVYEPRPPPDPAPDTTTPAVAPRGGGRDGRRVELRRRGGYSTTFSSLLGVPLAGFVILSVVAPSVRAFSTSAGLASL